MFALKRSLQKLGFKSFRKTDFNFNTKNKTHTQYTK